MPIYEYQCALCGHHLEAFQKVSEEPLKDCPECHKPALNKQISASGFQLKGSGWYATDYSSKGKSKETESKAPETKVADSKPSDSSSNSSSE